MKKRITAIELFAGIGGFRIAADENGIETIWANDIDPTASTVYRSRFGNSIFVEGDINSCLNLIPDHDLLTGGFPCQPFSRAGKKMGIEDYRGTLFESIVKILSTHKPNFFILENVNSLLYLNNGRHFKTILWALTEQGYKVEWRVFNAVHFGLPQNRERLIIVGTKDKSVASSFFFSPRDMRENPVDTIDKIPYFSLWQDVVSSKQKFLYWGMSFDGKYITASINESASYASPKTLSDVLQEAEEIDKSFYFNEGTIERIKESIFVNKFYNGVHILYNQGHGARMGYTIFGTDGIAPTLTASASRHYERYAVGNSYRRLTNIEYARIQGFPDDHCSAISIYKQYKLFGNAVPPQIISYVMKKLINGVTYTISPKQRQLFDI